LKNVKVFLQDVSINICTCQFFQAIDPSIVHTLAY
jgi:hypothetical protein